MRLTGSSDLYRANTRRPLASVNFVTAHDGFTLHDLVSYNEKHNEANGEDNNDGENHNRSWNCGVEGPTTDPDILECRRRQQRNPMLLGGDEIGLTQQGNNNGYCQDNEISWFHWESVDSDLLEFTRRLIAFRRQHPVFHRRRWFHGRPIRGTVDISWFRPDGQEMSDEDWEAGFARAIGLYLNGDAIAEKDQRGQPVTDDSFVVLLNTGDTLEWTLPAQWASSWEESLRTAPEGEGGLKSPAGPVLLPQRSILVLRKQE